MSAAARSRVRRPTRARGGLAVTALLVVIAGLGVARLQPRLARTVHEVKSREDVYVLPPPEQLRVSTLGYHAAATDLMWAKLLVEYGVHYQERREFPDLEKYVEAILTLEPDYAPVFNYVVALVTYRPPRGYEKDARTTRAILERGLKARPDDGKVWMEFGDFLTFVAPSFLGDEEEIQRWRREGVDALMHGAQLGGDVNHAISGAEILSKRGETDAAVKNLERLYTLAEGQPDRRAEIERKLDRLHATQVRDRLDRHEDAVYDACNRALPFVPSVEGCLLLGPFPSTLACAGPASAADVACARTWGDAALATVR